MFAESVDTGACDHQDFSERAVLGLSYRKMLTSAIGTWWNSVFLSPIPLY
jgi:hypothetical protein